MALVALTTLAAFALRALDIRFNIRMGPPGEFVSLGKPPKKNL